MKKTKAIIFFSSLFFLLMYLFSCQPGQDAKSPAGKKKTLAHKKELCFPMGDKLHVFTRWYAQIIPVNNNLYVYVFFDDKESPRISVYDINKKKPVKTIKLHKEGPHKIISPGDCYIHNPDSFFISGGGGRILYLVNARGELEQQWRLDNKYKEYSAYANFPNRLHYNAKSNTVTLHVGKRGSEVNADFYDNMYVGIFDLDKGKFRHLIPMPFSPDGWYPGTMMPQVEHDDEYLYLSAIFTGTIWKYRIRDGKLIKKADASSPHVPKPLKALPYSAFRGQEEIDWLVKNAFYSGLAYDPYHDCLYRLIKHEQDLYKDESTGELNFFNDAPHTVQILDKELNVTGECFIDHKKMAHGKGALIWPAPNGLMVLSEKYRNTEDTLYYDLYVQQEISGN